MSVKPQHLLSLLQNDFTTVQVVFRDNVSVGARHDRTTGQLSGNSQAYTYKAPLGIKVGDVVVVDSPKSGLVCAPVTHVDAEPIIDTSAPFEYKWIVQVVDYKSYQDRCDREAEFLVQMKKIERQRQQQALVADFAATLPEGSEARRLFNEALGKLGAPALPASAPGHRLPGRFADVGLGEGDLV